MIEGVFLFFVVISGRWEYGIFGKGSFIVKGVELGKGRFVSGLLG